MNRQEFYNEVRSSSIFGGRLSAAQVQGMERLLDVWGQWYEKEYPIQFLSAALIQIAHETGTRMVPIMETYSSDARTAANILERAYNRGQLPWVKQRYWLADSNGKIWIGRGDIQLTHKSNYAKSRKNIKAVYDADIPLDVDPELALHPVVSAVCAYEGMIKGLFTGKKLSSYLSGDDMDYVEQRETVNGDKKDSKIAAKMKSGGQMFERALHAAGAVTKGVGVLSPRQFPNQTIVAEKIEKDEPPAGDPVVKAVQARLHAHGYGEIVGAVDGWYGPKTEKAIDAFETEKNIKLAHVDAATWDALQKTARGEKTE